MQNLDRQIIKSLRNKIQDTLAANTIDGFETTVGNASYTDTEVTFKVNLRLLGAKSQSEKDLETFAMFDDLDIDKLANINGKTFKLSGYRRKARTKPYLMKDVASGNEYITTEDTAKRYFKKENQQ